MPISHELVGSPWPESMTTEEIREALLKSRKQKEGKLLEQPPAKQGGCTLSPDCQANYHTIGCPALKGKQLKNLIK